MRTLSAAVVSLAVLLSACDTGARAEPPPPADVVRTLRQEPAAASPGTATATPSATQPSAPLVRPISGPSPVD